MSASTNRPTPTTRADRSRLAYALRLVLVLGALVAAVALAPIGSDIAGTDQAPAPTVEASRLSAADQRVLMAGRQAPMVGEPTPVISFSTFEGSLVELHGRTRPVILLFLGDPCRECDAELGKLAVIGTITFEDAWVAALADPGSSAQVQQGVVDAGGTDLFYAGVDERRDIAGSFGIEQNPATVVLDAQGRVAAVWQRSIPAGVVLELIRTLTEAP